MKKGMTKRNGTNGELIRTSEKIRDGTRSETQVHKRRWNVA